MIKSDRNVKRERSVRDNKLCVRCKDTEALPYVKLCPKKSGARTIDRAINWCVNVWSMIFILFCNVRLTYHWINASTREFKPHSLYLKLSLTYFVKLPINPLTAKLFNLNFHPLEVVSRWRDPQLQVSENYLDLTKWRSSVFKYCWLMWHFIFNMFKRWYLMCCKKWKLEYMRHRRLKG